MSEEFNAVKDFLLPIGVFTERLLGNGIDPAIKEKTADIQAMLIVFDKYLVPNDAMFENVVDIEKEKKKYKDDFFFKNMHRPYADLKKELLDIVPAESDVESELVQARAVVDAGKGVPNVPPFGMILSKFLPRELVNTCLQVQAGLRIMAINNQWPNNEKIPAARIFDNDPKELNAVQFVLNSVHENYISKINQGEQPGMQTLLAMPFSQTAGFAAIMDAQQKFILQGQSDAVKNLYQYMASESGIGNNTYNIGYEAAVEKYFSRISKNKSSDNNTPKF